MSTPELRPYQIELLGRARQQIASGHKRIIIQAATGSGKQHITAEILRLAVAKGKRALFLAHRRQLIKQKCERLDLFGVPYGVIMNGIGQDPEAPVQVASRDTLLSRGVRDTYMELPPADIVIIDEAHRAVAEQYQVLLGKYPNSIIVGATATPARADGKGMAPYFQAIECAVPTRELIKNGFLVPVQCYAPRSAIKGKGKVKRRITSDPVARYIELARDRRAIVFCSKVVNSLSVCNHFNAAGIKAEHMDDHTEDDEREAIITRVRRGETKILCNVGVLCLDSETEILTSDGWVGMDEMTYQHKVANWDQGKIFFKEPKYIVRRDREPEEKMALLECDKPSMKIRVTDCHRMLYRTFRKGKFLIKPARELINKRVQYPVCGVADPTHIHPEQEHRAVNSHRIASNAYELRKKYNLDSKTSLELAKKNTAERDAMRYSEPHELTLDECELIGFWIGDGSVDHLQSGGREYKLSQVSYCKNICERISQLLTLCGIDFVIREKPNDHGNLTKQWSMPRGTGGGTQKRRGVYHLEPYLNKDGTKLFWGMSREQFMTLLRGFWMADGTCHKDNIKPDKRFTICGTNKKLFDLLQAIAVCRGISVGLIEKKHRPTWPSHYKTMYHFVVMDRHSHNCSRQPLQIETTPWKQERVWCVTSDTGNIIIRRHGTVLVTGNTEGTDIPELSCCILLRLAHSYVLFMQAVGRVMRPCPEIDKKDAILLDHSGAVTVHGFPDDDVEWQLEGDVDERIKKDKKDGKRKKPIYCKQCGCLFSDATICPQCQYDNVNLVTCNFCGLTFSGTVTCPGCGERLPRHSKSMEVKQELLVPIYSLDQDRQVQAMELRQRIWNGCVAVAVNRDQKMVTACAMYRQKTGQWPESFLRYRPLGNQWYTKARDLFPQFLRGNG